MNNKTRYILVLVLLSFVASCSYFQQAESGQVLARAGKSYLYLEDLPAIGMENNSKEDSTAKVNRYIENWALQTILLEKAKFNLPKDQQEEFDAMAEKYRIQLYINAYKDALIDKNFTSSFSDDEIIDYYEANKQNFKLKETLLKLRYLVIKSDLKDVDIIKTKFESFTYEDQVFLENKRLEFKKLMLNDSVWVRWVDVQKELPNIHKDLGRFINQNPETIGVFKDSLYTYFVQVNQKLVSDEVPPISYLKPTIKQILENKRKLELNKKLEKDILNDAIQNNDVKIN